MIEDAACALGAKYSNKQAGTWGVLGCFSFHPRKAITTGEGGIITTDDDELAHQIQILRNHGQDPLTKEFVAPGYNYRMTEFQAAMGIEQMKKVNRIIESRVNLSKYYTKKFKDTPFTAPFQHPDASSVYQTYVILLPEELVSKRFEVIQELRNRNIESTIGTVSITETKYYSERYGFKRGDYPSTDHVSDASLSLPLYKGLTNEEQDYIVENLLDLVS